MIVVSMAVLVACDGQSGPGEPSPAPSDTAATLDYHRFGAPREVAAGILLGMSLDGSAAYVADVDPAFPQAGCEGRPEPVLFRQPLSGEPRELLGDGTNPVKGDIVRGSGGAVALVNVCEEFFNGLVVGKESADGRFTDLSPVQLNPSGPGNNPAAFSFSWTPDGKSLLAAINDPEAPDGGPARLVRIDPGSGRVTRLFTGEGGTGVFQFAQLRGGSYVVAANQEVTFRDGDGNVTASFPGNGFTVLPNRESIVIYGESVFLASEDSDEARSLAGPRPGYEVSSASVSPDGEAVAFNRYALQGSENEIAVTTVDDGKTSSIVTGEGYGEPLFSGTGRALAFNFFEPGAEFSPKIMVAELEA